jgi:hypothetical protein
MSVLTGNASDIKDLTVSRQGLAGVAGSHYGFFISGITNNGGTLINVIDYIDATDIGGTNAIDRGDVPVPRHWVSGISGLLYGLFFGGTNSPYNVFYNEIDYLDMSLLVGNSSDRGDLSNSIFGVAGAD